MFKKAIYYAIFLLLAASIMQAARIKDIATLEGTSEVQVIGYGLVTGLNNSGDNQRTSFTVQSVSNMLKRFGLTIPQSNPRIRNVAAVMVTASIPAFMNAGSKVDVQVSSIGDANSLEGGILLMSPMSTTDGKIVGYAQGAMSVGGYDVRAYGSRVSKNNPTSGRVPNGLILESAIEGSYIDGSRINISLREPDFTTANRIAEAVNGLVGLVNSASPIDAGTVSVQFRDGIEVSEAMQLIAQIEAVNVITDPVAKVVINERTGTIVIGGNVELLPAVIAHSGLEISIQKQVIVPQPAPFTIRPPQIAETAEIETREELRPATPLVVQGPLVQDIADALNMLNVNPRDLISIFQALKTAGSLQGELVIQ